MNWIKRLVTKKAVLRMAAKLEIAMEKRRHFARLMDQPSHPLLMRVDMHLFVMLKHANEVLDIYEGTLKRHTKG